MKSLQKVSITFLSRVDLVDVNEWITGGCSVDQSYAGPQLDQEDGKYKITYDFIKAMIQWFKDGKTLPKRYVWEIVIGAYEQFSNSDSLVNVQLEDGVTCDVIGDVHGTSALGFLSAGL